MAVTTGTGLAKPDLSWAAQRLGLTPVPERDAWLRMSRVYLIAREYLGPVERARGRDFDCGGWTAALLARYSREEYLGVLAALNHATTSDALVQEYQERFLARLVPGVALCVRSALGGGVDGERRWFLARQMVLRAMRLVLAPPSDPAGQAVDSAVTALVGQLDVESAAVLLVHTVADSLTRERPEGEPRLGGIPQSLAMEMIANNLFNEADDPGDLLALHRLLWTHYGDRATAARIRPLDMLEEAIGLAYDDLVALGFAYYSGIANHRPDNPVAMDAFTNIAIDPSAINRFLDRFSLPMDDLAAELGRCSLPWQMLPIQDRPLLRVGDRVVVLDERYLLERITQGLYWLVHDHEKFQYGETARIRWTQAYADMVEQRVEDALRHMAPPLLGAEGSTFFTEHDLFAAFPKSKAVDAGIDFGSSAVLAEVVSATVSVATREDADADAFRRDTERIVVKKARQLSGTALNLLRDPQPAGSPLATPARAVFPVAVRDGHYPVNPITRTYLQECFDAEGLFQHGAIRALSLLDMEELGACEALHQNRGVPLPDLLAGWHASPYSQASFRSFLVHQYGGQSIGRTKDMDRSLRETTEMIGARLGFPRELNTNAPSGATQ